MRNYVTRASDTKRRILVFNLLSLVLLISACKNNSTIDTNNRDTSKAALLDNVLLSESVSRGTARFELNRRKGDSSAVGRGLIDFNEGRSYVSFDLQETSGLVPPDQLASAPPGKVEFIFEGTTGFVRSPGLGPTWWKRDWSADLRPEVLREDLSYLVNDPKSVFGVVIQAQNLLPPSPSGDRQPQTLRSNVMLEETRVATLVPSLRLLASAFLGRGVREVPMELTLDEDGLIETVVLTRSEPENQPPTTYSFRFFDYGAPVDTPLPQGPIRDRSELERGYETKSGREQLYPSETPDPQPT